VRLWPVPLQDSAALRAIVVALLALGTMAIAGAADDEAVIKPIVSLRATGYLLGDLIDERVDLTLPDRFSVDADSLPLPGRVAPWLEVRRARLERGDGRNAASVIVTYQIFAEVEQVARVPIPSFKLRLRGGGQNRVVTVPEKLFLLSPALPPVLADEDRELKPSARPQPLPLAEAAGLIVIGIVGALACAAYLLWAHDRLPFLPRSPGPFARLWRRWRRRGRHELSEADRRSLLREWHAALNQSADETLYASTLPRVFIRAPYLEPLRAEIEQQFERSWRSFYATAPLREPMPQEPTAREILALLRAAAERERGVPC
jgi:mxaA protein